MRKILAATLISGLALLPTASAWADTAAPSGKDVEVASTSGDPSGERKLFAFGCHGGSVFAMYIADNGLIRGQVFGMLPCAGETFYYVN